MLIVQVRCKFFLFNIIEYMYMKLLRLKCFLISIFFSFYTILRNISCLIF